MISLREWLQRTMGAGRRRLLGPVFLKYVASHPAVAAITPATSRPSNMADNMGAAVGRLPDAAMRKRMIKLVEELP
jgi:aryl-alcohol dehydrogenase-like predicted oxidoreductase